MARSSRFLAVFAAVSLFGIVQTSSNVVVQSVKCQLPNTTIPWESNPETKTVNVTWQYGNNYTCQTAQECFGVKNIKQNGFAASSVSVQLHPVQLQRGNNLRFHFKRYMSTSRYHIYKVDAASFHNCNASLGKRVWKDNGNDVFDMPSKFLDTGNNYFVVATNISAFISCNLGLRLNVMVKAENCTGNVSGVCGGRGMCVTNRHQDNFACQCCGTYKGENCSVFDACLSSPCQNGGECLKGNATKNATRGYQCKCAIGFHGDNCEHNAQNLCDLVHCHNGATCRGSATSFNCTCAPGWTGSQCEVDINDCESEPCRHGHCVDKLNGYNCSCYPGYYGENCSLQRTSCKFSPCQNGGFCENQTVSHQFKYACHCMPGWNGTDCSQRVSPCEPNPCTSRGFCMEEYDSFKCVCQPGFSGHRCEININDCEPNPCLQGGHCLDLEQGHMCSCVQTHYGSNCQYTIPLSSYTPASNNVVNNVVVVHDSDKSHATLAVVAGVVTATVLVIILVLVGCYLRTTESYNNITCVPGLFKRKTNNDLTVQVSVSNTPDCPLNSNSFFQGSKSQLDLGVDNKAFHNELV